MLWMRCHGQKHGRCRRTRRERAPSRASERRGHVSGSEQREGGGWTGRGGVRRGVAWRGMAWRRLRRVNNERVAVARTRRAQGERKASARRAQHKRNASACTAQPQRTAHGAQRTAHSARRTAHSAQRTAHSAHRQGHDRWKAPAEVGAPAAAASLCWKRRLRWPRTPHMQRPRCARRAWRWPRSTRRAWLRVPQTPHHHHCCRRRHRRRRHRRRHRYRRRRRRRQTGRPRAPTPGGWGRATPSTRPQSRGAAAPI